MSTVLTCVDSSAAALPVLRAAMSIAPLFGAAVDAVHVTEDGAATPIAAARNLGVALRVVDGDVVGALATLASDEEVVAVVCGARGRPIGTHPLGHVALELVDRAGAPVLVVPPDAQVADRVRRVLVAMKGTPANARTLERAVALVAGADIEIVVVHVDSEASIPSFSDQVQHETDAYAGEFLARYVPEAPLARLELRIGVPAAEILDAADTMMPDAIAMGHWRGGGRSEVVLEVLERSHVPVLLVATT